MVDYWDKVPGINEAAIKDADITVGSKFKLQNGEMIEIKRLFKEKRNSDEPWVEFNRSGGGSGPHSQQGKNENSVKSLRQFLRTWKAKKV